MSRISRALLAALLGLAMTGLVTLPTATASAAPAVSPSGDDNGGHSPADTNQRSTRAEQRADGVEQLCSLPEGKGAVRCFAEVRTGLPSPMGLMPNADPNGYGPADLQDAYDLPSDEAGEGATVAVVAAYDDPTAEEDLAVYRSQYGLPPCTTENGCFRKVDQRGGQDYPAPDPGWAGEISLDLDMVSAACPNCNILLVEADGPYINELGEAVQTAVDLGADYVSNSYGGTEFPEETQADAYYNHPGVAVTVSSGDYGYGATYPAASPYVTSVGGTTLRTADNARGWTETVWSGAGSGCSRYEEKPDVQLDADCAKRTIADVSAVSDPQTGVAVYQTYGASGWQVMGGTSAAAPLIAATYALAGPATADEHPNTFPYFARGALHDVVSGNNGQCGGSYLCTGTEGYDGPTGLGTPNGIAAFTQPGEHGTLTGKVSDADTGEPVAHATVTIGDQVAHTAADGTYTFALKVGEYDVVAAAFGYADSTAHGVAVTDGETTTRDFALEATPSATVAGNVTDGSGHGWPLAAKVTVEGTPLPPVYTDPQTGRYQLDLPIGATYTLHVESIYGGYQVAEQRVELDENQTSVDIAPTIDPDVCAAPGYRMQGLYETFDKERAVDAGRKPDGWTVVNNTDDGWIFQDSSHKGNRTGGTGYFATVPSEWYGFQSQQDTQLITPAVDLSDVSDPSVELDTEYFAPLWTGSHANIDLSVDGGETWSTVWEHDSPTVGPTRLQIAIPQAAGESDVKVRFHYTGGFDMWWQIDNVLIGKRDCHPVPGGLLIGRVTNATDHAPVVGATVTSDAVPADYGISHHLVSTGDIPNGMYWLFSSRTGEQAFTTSHPSYTDATQQVDVEKGWVTRSDVSLGAGHLTIDKQHLEATARMGQHRSRSVTLTNDGTAPVAVSLHEASHGMTLAEAAKATPDAVPTITKQVQATSGFISPALAKKMPAAQRDGDAMTPAATGDWTQLSNLPDFLDDPAVGVHDGKVYAVGGFEGTLYEGSTVATGHVYDPQTMRWSSIAKMETPRQRATGAFIGDKFYVTGGWDAGGGIAPTTEIYDPATDSWSNGASMPKPLAASGNAVLGGKLYVVGGCSVGNGTLAGDCGKTDVQVYDPAENRWTMAADYPVPVAWAACGTIVDKLYCAGGDYAEGDVVYDNAYVYDPVYDSWSPIAPLPTGVWGASYTAANGRLVVSGGIYGGVTDGVVTNKGYAYNPGTDAWKPIPNAPVAIYRGGSACGMYVIGGMPGGFPGQKGSWVLPGYDACAAGDVPWMDVTTDTLTLKPGQSTEVRVAFDSGRTEQPGTYTGAVQIHTDAPRHADPVTVTLHVNPPKKWGLLNGTVLGKTCSGSTDPIAGAFVEIDSWAGSWARKTDADGHFALWMDKRNSKLTVVASKDGWIPDTARKVHVRGGRSTDLRLVLTPLGGCAGTAQPGTAQPGTAQQSTSPTRTHQGG